MIRLHTSQRSDLTSRDDDETVCHARTVFLAECVPSQFTTQAQRQENAAMAWAGRSNSAIPDGAPQLVQEPYELHNIRFTAKADCQYDLNVNVRRSLPSWGLIGNSI